jgi:hypothetical protein
MQTSAGDGETTAGPRVFVIGPLRAGTTLLRLMLAHHPKIAWIGEFDYAVDWPPPGCDPADRAARHHWLGHNTTFVDQQLTLDPTLTTPALMDSFLEQARQRAGKPIVGGTVHRHFKRLLELWPEAKLIHLVRDGRDVARSWIGMGLGGTVYTGARAWREAELLADRVQQRAGEGQFQRIYYEQLVRAPRQTLNEVCQHIGVPFDEAMLDYAATTTYSYPDPSLTEQWRRKLDARAIRRVEAVAGDMLAARGYERAWPDARLSTAQRHWLTWADRLGRVRFRLKRFGPNLTMQHQLTRLLGTPRWHQRVQYRMEQIDRQYLQ